MPIQYAPNAAAISWLALSQALKNFASMKQELFALFAENTSLSITETQYQASNTQKALEDQAKQTMWAGIMSMCGAGAELGVTALTTLRGGSLLKQSSAPNIESEAIFKEEKVIPEVKGDIPMKTFSESTGSATLEGQTPPLTQSASAQVQGEPTIAAKTAVSPSEKAKADSEEADTAASKKQQARKEELERNANWWLQNSNNFSTTAGQILNGGVSSLIQQSYIRDQGQAQAAAKIAEGIGAVFTSQSGLFTSALSTCDTYMQNTSSVISAIIAASSVRG